MQVQDILARFHAAAVSPAEQMRSYLAQGKKVVLCAPVYTPEELIHAMGLVPMGVWGADVELEGSKQYFPAFICSIMQSILELGMKGSYDGASAIVIPSLCDSLKVLGQNWKYAVPGIPFVPMTYPQNRRNAYGAAFVKAGYQRVIREVESATGARFDEESLARSLAVYNEHNAAMRELSDVLAEHPEVTAGERSDIFKSAFFLLKEEHTALVRELTAALKAAAPAPEKLRIMTTGILADAPGLNSVFDELGMHIVCDDVAAQSRQYRTDAPEEGTALDCLAAKFCAMGDCSVLYDAEKGRVTKLVADAKAANARCVVVLLTKFCDPEEFDYPLIRKACEEAGLAVVCVEVDRQMVHYGQARTLLQTLQESLEM